MNDDIINTISIAIAKKNNDPLYNKYFKYKNITNIIKSRYYINEEECEAYPKYLIKRKNPHSFPILFLKKKILRIYNSNVITKLISLLKN